MRSFRLRGSALTIAGIVVLALAQSGNAAKEGFEPGDPAVSSTGDAGTQGTFQGEAPPEGSNQFLITTIRSTDGDGVNPVSGTNAVINSALQTFLHGIVLPGTEGSGVLIPFTVAAGDTLLTFQYDFLTNEQGTPHHNDFAFDAIFDSSNVLQGGINQFITADGAQASLVLFDGQDPFIFHTGYQTLTLSIAGLAPGNYSLGIGVEDRTTSDIASGLLIDNVQVVPEPSTVGLGMAGVVLLIALRRVIKKTS
ncbi:MAG: hypothetical protein QOE73_975 [Verrucomicrobiota bacterium]